MSHIPELVVARAHESCVPACGRMVSLKSPSSSSTSTPLPQESMQHVHLTSHYAGGSNKQEAENKKRRLRRQATTVEYEVPATQRQDSAPSTPGSARRQLFQDAQSRSDMSLIRSPEKGTSVFGNDDDDDEQGNQDKTEDDEEPEEEEQDENKEKEDERDDDQQEESEEEEGDEEGEEKEPEKPAPRKRPAARVHDPQPKSKVQRTRGAKPGAKSKAAAKKHAKAKASPKKTPPARKGKATQLKESSKARAAPGSASDAVEPWEEEEEAASLDGRSALTRAETQEIEAEALKTAKFKAYKARKERFYRSLRSRILS